MNFFPMKRVQAGIEISSDTIKSALIQKKGKQFSIIKLSDVKIPEQTIKPSFKKDNIINPEFFHDCLNKVCKGIKLTNIGVALPDSCVKVLVRTYKELPKSTSQIKDMVLWDISTSLNLPANELRVSWDNMGKNSEGANVLLIALSLNKVIGQYEQVFKQLGMSPVMLSPAGLSQFNFYSSLLPGKGNIAYLGLFDDFLNIFAFCDNTPVFYKIIKKGLLNNDETSAINDFDLLIQFYNSEFPDFHIEKFFIASNIKDDTQMERILQDLDSIEFTIIDEEQLIDFDKKFELDLQNNPLPFYTSVIGAAQRA